MKYMFVPGHVENWVILLETNSLGPSEFPIDVKF
jgi:hypothetical protein